MDVKLTQTSEEVFAIVKVGSISILNQGHNDRDRCTLKKY